MIRKNFLGFLLLVLLMATATLYARPRLIFFDSVMKQASFIGKVVIDHYDTSGYVYYHSTEFEPIVKRVYTGYKREDWDSGSSLPYYYTMNLTSTVPCVGDSVVLVLGARGNVSFFAKKVGRYYRFWSPYWEWSIPIYNCGCRAKPIPDMELPRNDDKASGGWDGCIVSQADVEFYRQFCCKKAE